jgi:hypothetical protein
MDGFVKGEKPRFIESFPIAPKVLIADEKLNHLLPIAHCQLHLFIFFLLGVNAFISLFQYTNYAYYPTAWLCFP